MFHVIRKYLVIAVLLFTASYTGACRKGYDFRDATITGYDPTLCGCCGGLMMKIDGETPPGNSPYFLLNNKPSEFGIDSSTVFPIYGRVVWVTDETRCNGKVIEVIAWIKR